MLKGPSFRKRMKVQKKPKVQYTQRKFESYTEKRARIDKLRAFLYRGLNMYKAAISGFEPYSEEYDICINNITTYTYDLEIVMSGTNEEREEVYKKYGEYIH